MFNNDHLDTSSVQCVVTNFIPPRETQPRSVIYKEYLILFDSDTEICSMFGLLPLISLDNGVCVLGVKLLGLLSFYFVFLILTDVRR